MKPLTVTIPDPLADRGQSRADSGQYASAGDYVHALIHRDRRDRERHAAVVAALIEGEQSGLSHRTRDEIIAEARAELDEEQV